MDEIGDGADLEPVLRGENFQLRQTRHGAVFVHDLADDAGGLGRGEAREIATGLGVSGAGLASGLTAARTVVARSAAEMPVVTPCAASIETVKAVDSLRCTPLCCNGSFSCSQRSAVSVRQISPRPWRAMKLMSSGRTCPPAMTRSPSFSRSSSSIRTTMRPRLISSMISVMGLIGIKPRQNTELEPHYRLFSRPMPGSLPSPGAFRCLPLIGASPAFITGLLAQADFTAILLYIAADVLPKGGGIGGSL